MVTRDSAWLPGTPCWVDVTVDDVDKAVAFYTALFGWTVEISSDPAFGGYGNFSKDGRLVAGVSPSQQPGQPPYWTTYVASDNVDQTASRIKEAGGQVLFDPMDVGPAGRMIVATDPSGAAFGVWQAGTHTGFALANEPGSVSWNEHMSQDFEANKKFYAAVFGYDYGDMSSDEFSYATMDLNGNSIAGIGTMGKESAGVPASWTTYFAVADTDATVRTALELGGKVIAEPFDIPQGRVAVLADDQDAIFGVIKL